MRDNQIITVELTPAPPYSFERVLTYIRTSPSAVLESVYEDGVYRRALELDGVGTLLTLWSEGTEDSPRLVLEVAHGHISHEAPDSAPSAQSDWVTQATGSGMQGDLAGNARQLVTRIFSLDEDPEPFERVCSGDPVLAALVARYRGLRPILIADPFESLMWAVIGQQINVAFARKLKLALIEVCGYSLHVGDYIYPLMPPPDRVASLRDADLRAIQFSRQKSAYVLGLAEVVASGDLDLEALRLMPYEDAVNALVQHNGVGRWTAEYVLMRGLGFRDSIPAADLGLRAIIGQDYGLGRTATEVEVRSLAEAWIGYRGWVSFYLWMDLQSRHAARKG